MANRKKFSKLVPLYCTDCGLKLVDKPLHSHYHRITGREVFTVYSRCPNKRRFYDKHSGFWRHKSYPEGDVTLMFYEDGSEAL